MSLDKQDPEKTAAANIIRDNLLIDLGRVENDPKANLEMEREAALAMEDYARVRNLEGRLREFHLRS